MSIKSDIEQDCNLCIEYMKEIRKEQLKENFIKEIHKIAYIYLDFQSIISNDKTLIIYKEIVSNIVHLLFLSYNIDKKILLMLNRNSIDNIIKIAKSKYEFDDNFKNKKIEEKFEMIKKFNDFNKLEVYSKSIDYMLTEYKKGCGYIHSTKLDYLTTYQTIAEYRKNVITYKDLNNINKFYKNMLLIIFVIYNNEIKNYKNHDKLTRIRSFLYKNYVKEYLKFFYDVDF